MLLISLLPFRQPSLPNCPTPYSRPLPLASLEPLPRTAGLLPHLAAHFSLSGLRSLAEKWAHTDGPHGAGSKYARRWQPALSQRSPPAGGPRSQRAVLTLSPEGLRSQALGWVLCILWPLFHKTPWRGGCGWGPVYGHSRWQCARGPRLPGWGGLWSAGHA